MSKCQNIDKEILFKIAYCTPNKMARVVDGGFAYRVSEMINRAALLSTSQMLENSVPNSSVLVISLQQSEKSRECIVKIQDLELLHADRGGECMVGIDFRLPWGEDYCS